MNLSRALAGFLAASSRSKKWALLSPAASATAALRSSPLSTVADAPAKRAYKRAPKSPEAKPVTDKPGASQAARKPPPPSLDPSKLPRPGEIPFQPRVANAVHLVGKVGVPVELEASPDGTYSAVSVLVQERAAGFPQFWIPVIFQGDLAQIAACHLKEDDLVYVTGQLSGDSPPLTVKDAQTNVQVLVHSLSFVEKTSPKKEGEMVHKQNKVASHCSASVEEKLPTLHLWNDLLSNPHKWWDNRASKSNPSSAAFKHKDSGQLLWINQSTPEWVLSKLDTLSFGPNTPTLNQRSGNAKYPQNHPESLWSDLITNPQQWRDNRMDKINELVKPKYPDFTHKGTNKGLWLNVAPEWVLLKLDGLEFHENIGIMKQGEGRNRLSLSAQGNGKEGLWKDLLENPNKWWDNRSNKLNPKSPDFKHKDSGEGLWLGSSPPWVLQNLPPLTSEKKDDLKMKVTLLS